MALEDYLLEQIAREAAPLLLGESVGRVFEPGPLELALALRRSDNLCLYCSLLPSRPGLFLTNRSFKALESKRAPGYFTNLLRKYLTGSTLSAFEKEPGERQLRADFASFDPAGAPLTITLLIELTGRSANAHLFAGLAYLASLRDPTRPPSLTPTSSNSLSDADKFIEARELGKEKFEALLAGSSLEAVARRFAGFSPTLVRELEARARRSSPFDALRTLLLDLYERPARARIYAPSALEQLKPGEIEPRRNLLLTYIDLTIAAGLTENRFATLNSAADTYFALLVRVEAFHSRRNAMLAKLKTEATRLEILQKKLRDETAEFGRADEYRRTGDLILANLATLRRADDKLFLTDLFHPDLSEVVVTVNSGESPQQAAERYFKLYQRARRGLQAASKRSGDVERELARKRQIASTVAAAMTEGELDEAESPLFPSKERKGKRAARPVKADRTEGVSLRHYLSSDGYEILVGRSDASNDQLTFRIAKPADVWLHAADYPGPHVVIRNPERRAVPQRTIYEAAQLAAFFSKARGETSAAVRYSERKNISRPKKGKPGLVLLTQFKTILVPPQEAGQRLL